MPKPITPSHSALKSKHNAWVFSVCFDSLHSAQLINRHYSKLKTQNKNSLLIKKKDSTMWILKEKSLPLWLDSVKDRKISTQQWTPFSNKRKVLIASVFCQWPSSTPVSTYFSYPFPYQNKLDQFDVCAFSSDSPCISDWTNAKWMPLKTAEHSQLCGSSSSLLNPSKWKIYIYTCCNQNNRWKGKINPLASLGMLHISRHLPHYLTL